MVPKPTNHLFLPEKLKKKKAKEEEEKEEEPKTAE